MKTQLYSILDTAARSWWYHHRLRQQGRVVEARKLEREFILHKVQILRQALENNGFLLHGRKGWMLNYDKWAGLTKRCIGLDQPIIQACLLLGIPVLDTMTIPDDRIRETLGMPIASTHPDPEPEGGYGPHDHAPFEYVARRYVELGATVYNLADHERKEGSPWTTDC